MLVNCQDLGKSFGDRALFSGLSFSIQEGDRVGLIGPNGAGKSTLMKILADIEPPDEGECVRRRELRVGYVPQKPTFDSNRSVRDIVAAAANEEDHRIDIVLSRTGFSDPDVTTDRLSGGWRTRLAIACALVAEPDLLLLDEPTNHLDLESIEWLEGLLATEPKAFVVISHDRAFLQNVCRRVIDIDRSYPLGLLAVDGTYADLLEARDETLANQASYQSTLANRVRREIEWLRRGPKARTTKSKARIDAAHESMAELADSRERTGARNRTAGIELTSSGRRTKRLWHARGLTKAFDSKKILEDLELLLVPGMRLGVMGPIGSGKSTLLRLMVGEMEPDSGTIERAHGLRTVYFDQHRTSVDENVTLKRALAPEGDSVVYQNREVHVASWARRFLFRSEQLEQPVSRLSGGEKARIGLAKLMLQPADLLILDEPTNDLDISTLEILEESLLEFQGALVLVSHDRHMIERVTTEILAVEGEGHVTRYADYAQWQAARKSTVSAKKAKPKTEQAKPKSPRKKLSYNEQREWDGMEERVALAEALVAESQQRAEDPTIASDPAELETRHAALVEAERQLDELYQRWAELEAKQS